MSSCVPLYTFTATCAPWIGPIVTLYNGALLLFNSNTCLLPLYRGFDICSYRETYLYTDLSLYIRLYIYVDTELPVRTIYPGHSFWLLHSTSLHENATFYLSAPLLMDTWAAVNDAAVAISVASAHTRTRSFPEQVSGQKTVACRAQLQSH